jgi:uncharacterized phage protein (predicted DNA packaging)
MITLTDAKLHLRVDHTEEDDYILRLVGAAEELVEIHLRQPLSNFDPVPKAIEQAMLLLIGHWFEHREAVIDGWRPNTVPFTVDCLLAGYRNIEF